MYNFITCKAHGHTCFQWAGQKIHNKDIINTPWQEEYSVGTWQLHRHILGNVHLCLNHWLTEFSFLDNQLFHQVLDRFAKLRFIVNDKKLSLKIIYT